MGPRAAGGRRRGALVARLRKTVMFNGLGRLGGSRGCKRLQGEGTLPRCCGVGKAEIPLVDSQCGPEALAEAWEGFPSVVWLRMPQQEVSVLVAVEASWVEGVRLSGQGSGHVLGYHPFSRQSVLAGQRYKLALVLPLPPACGNVGTRC